MNAPAVWPKQDEPLPEGEYDPDEEYARDNADAWDGYDQ